MSVLFHDLEIRIGDNLHDRPKRWTGLQAQRTAASYGTAVPGSSDVSDRSREAISRVEA
jgi:hypothetical protein